MYQRRKSKDNLFFQAISTIFALPFTYIIKYNRHRQMNSFIKQALATVVGILFFIIITGALGAMSLVGMVASSQATKNVDDNSVLVLNLSGTMDERTQDNLLSMLGGNTTNNPGLENTLQAIKKARTNDHIKGIYIEAGLFSSDFASMQELRKALTDFRKSGKWIVAYADTYTQGTYYIASAANKVYLNPQGQVDWHGIASEPIFVKDLLAKFGIRMQVVKVGKYKSATEMFTADHMSEANRAQAQAYINGLWQNVRQGVAESRHISVAQLNTYADNLMTFDDQRSLIRRRIVDGLLYTDQVKGEVKKLLKLDADEPISQVSVADMANVKDGQTDGDEIAVYYAYGDIVTTPLEATGGLLGNSHYIVATEVCKDLASLADNDDVKAVVIRINSGGGSAYASEQIWHQIEMLKKKKPVVVSMGGMAASGGYYMSCNANWIVAQPTTLTGSIGIFGVIPDRSQLLTQKLGIKFDEVKTNSNATFGTSSRPMNAEELAYLGAYINRGYSLFRQRVADGRHLSVAQVEAVAQGHVFLGQDAIKLKLVDELGGIDQAVARAAKLAKVDEYYTYSYPGEPGLWDSIMGTMQNGNYLDEQMRATLGMYYEPFKLLRSLNQIDAIQARVPFFMNLR